MRRWAPLLIAATLVACGDDGSGGTAAPDTTAAADSTTTDASPSTTSAPGVLTPPTTEDVDGLEPDTVEPPPAGGVPAGSAPTPSSRRVALPGFGEVVVLVRTVDGEVEYCLLLAETAAQTQRGLMEVTDPELGGYDGMLFRFEDAHDGGFYMRNTPQPLEIAYLDPDGRVVAIREMDPCEDVDGCPTYPAGAPYLRTIEVPIAAGGVRGLGIVEGADVEVVDTGTTCAA